MNILLRYLTKQSLIANLSLLTILLTLVWLTQSLKLINIIINQGISLALFFRLTLLIIPKFFVYIIPISMFLTTLLLYNKYHSDRELVVMQSLGFSAFNILKPAILTGLIGCFTVLIFNTWVSPHSYSEFRKIQLALRYNASANILQPRKFNTFANGIAIYIKSIDKKGNFKNIFIDNNSNSNKHTTFTASSGIILKDKNNIHEDKIITKKCSIQIFNYQTKELKTVYLDRFVFSLNSLTNNNYHQGIIKVSQIKTYDLIKLIINTRKIKYVAELNSRIASSFTPLIYVLIASFSILFTKFSRHNKIKENLLAIAVFFVCVSLNLLLMIKSKESYFLVALFDFSLLLQLTGLLIFYIKKTRTIDIWSKNDII